MPGKTSNTRPAAATDWPAAIHRALKSQRVRQVSYVPDAGHKRLIELCHADKSMAVPPQGRCSSLRPARYRESPD